MPYRLNSQGQWEWHDGPLDEPEGFLPKLQIPSPSETHERKRQQKLEAQRNRHDAVLNSPDAQKWAEEIEQG